MKQDADKYNKVIELVKRNEPEIGDKEQLKYAILRGIKNTGRKAHPLHTFLDLVFGWVDVYWIRWTVTSVAMVIIGIFLIQQITISNRISSLEKQLISFEHFRERDPDSQRSYHRVLLKLYSPSLLDSITVSRSDLEALLIDYRKLIEKGFSEQEDKNEAGNNPPLNL